MHACRKIPLHASKDSSVSAGRGKPSNRSATPFQFLLVGVWIVFRSCWDLVIWYQIISNRSRFFSEELPIGSRIIYTFGMAVLTGYLNPHWLMGKVLP